MSALAKYSISDFSNHLFWDFDRNLIDSKKPSPQVVQRVLEYGLLRDWIVLSYLYSFEDILQTAMNLRNLDPKAVSFLMNLSGHTKEDFRCYTTRQLTPQHWNF